MIRAVERALAIFDAFDAHHQSLTLHEIGERIGMPKATTFRLVNTLQNGGFLVRLENQRYCLSLKILRLAGLVKSTLGIREAARPLMNEICKKTGETVTLNYRSGIERICIDVVDTPSPLMSIVRPGEHVSLLHGATARLLLAYAGDAQIDDIIARTPGADKLDVSALKAALEDIRRNGYSCTSGQRISGVTAISVPIFDINDEVHYSIAVTGPSIRMDARLDEFKAIMIEAGAAISALMGTSRTPPQQNAETGEDDTPDELASTRRSGPRNKVGPASVARTPAKARA
jgi:DNA-binding IclR family transcriptional regulator